MLPIYLKILAIAILRHVGYTVLKEFTAVHRLLFCRVFSYRFSYRMQESSRAVSVMQSGCSISARGRVYCLEQSEKEQEASGVCDRTESGFGQ